ncbi:MAG: hypothetical protein Q9180_002796 [Flavoplaca navasiana]
MPPITTNQTFPSLLAFKAALRDWAIERNFTPHILDSDSHRVRAGCRTSPNCPFRIRCNWNEKRGTAKVTTCEDVHTCLSSTTQALAHQHQDIKRAETGRLKFLLEIVPQLLDVTVTTTTSAIIDAVEQRYGQRIPLRQAQKPGESTDHAATATAEATAGATVLYAKSEKPPASPSLPPQKTSPSTPPFNIPTMTTT